LGEELVWFFKLISERDADMRWIREDKRRQLAARFAAIPELVFEHCRTICVEGSMSDLRATTGGRIPRDADIFDLMHVVSALAYCDAFVCYDGPLLSQAKNVCEKAGCADVVASSLSAAAESLGI